MLVNKKFFTASASFRCRHILLSKDCPACNTFDLRKQNRDDNLINRLRWLITTDGFN